MNFQSRSKILWSQNLTPRQGCSYLGRNKQTNSLYISFKTNLNMHVFQIVFSVFSLIRVSSKIGQSGSQVSDVVAVGACWVRVVISFGASNSSLGRVWVTVGWGQWVSGRRCEIGEML